MTAAAVRHRLRPPVPWRFQVARLYAPFVNFSIAGLVGCGWAYAGLTKTSHPGGEWTALWLSVLGAAVLMKVALAAGPVFAGPDRVFWVLSTPVSRGALLRPRFLWLLAAGAAVGAGWPAVVSGIVGAVVPPVAAAGAGSACGVAVVAGAVVLQWVRVRPQGWLSGLAGLAVVALLVPLWAGSGGGLLGTAGFPVRPGGWAGVIGAAWVVAIGLAVVAAAALRSLRRSDLAAGGALAGVARVSVSWFDLALLGAVLAERRARALGRVKSVRLRGSRLVVLAWTDALRLRRTPNAALVWAALLPAPALVSVGWEGAVVPAVHLVAAFLATDRLAAGLKFVCRSPAMRRALGLPDRQLRLAHLVFPAFGAIVWCAVTAAFTPHVSAVNALVSAVGAVAVVHRIATRPPIDYGAAVIDFGVFGPTPLGLVVQFSRGPALLAVLGLVQLAL
ncbi:DUF6297 family protein [Lentzea sp. NEAU-D7]|uniref:DUF6297 family protein n=1 Tax=Lentzea sp. NEAU-D7 TaxID=2994667 RepID=UPI00224ADDE1|nr:DUF6297 family protein [Lentzea sp. NEAU-D7]MCX2947306.1 DUF6297 family protein [Lentzea sp. NEAU-D7]